MRKLFSLLVITLLLLSANSLLFAQPPAAEEFSQGVFVDLATNDLKSDADIEKLSTALKDSYFNTVFPMVRIHGKTMYTSIYEPPYIQTSPTFQDPLAVLIDKGAIPSAEQATLTVIPWINILDGYQADFLKPSYDAHFLSKHSELIMVNKDNKPRTSEGLVTIDPLIPESQEYLIKIICELVKNYPKAPAVYIGDFSFPENGQEWGYNPITVAMFNKEKGKSIKPASDDQEWTDWRREKMTMFLEKIYSSIKAVRPDCKLAIGVETSAVVPKTIEDFKNTAPYKERFQDLPAWLDKGIVDIVVLKNFFSGTTAYDKYNAWIDFVNQNKKNAKVICAADGRKNYTNTMLEQLRAARAAGIAGSAVYQYREPVRDLPAKFYSTLKLTVFKKDFMNFKSSGIVYDPDLPALKKEVKADSKTTETIITFTPVPMTPIPSPTPTPFPEIDITPVPKSETAVKTNATESDEESSGEKIKKAEPSKGVVPAVTPTPEKWDKIYLKNGSVFEGRLINENATEATILKKGDMELRIKKTDIEKIVEIVE